MIPNVWMIHKVNHVTLRLVYDAMNMQGLIQPASEQPKKDYSVGPSARIAESVSTGGRYWNSDASS